MLWEEGFSLSLEWPAGLCTGLPTVIDRLLEILCTGGISNLPFWAGFWVLRMTIMLQHRDFSPLLGCTLKDERQHCEIRGSFVFSTERRAGEFCLALLPCGTHHPPWATVLDAWRMNHLAHPWNAAWSYLLHPTLAPLPAAPTPLSGPHRARRLGTGGASSSTSNKKESAPPFLRRKYEKATTRPATPLRT